MVNVTDEAKVLLDNVLKEALDNAQLPSPLERKEVGLRLVVQDKGLVLGVDSAHEGDQVVEHDGNPVLLISPDIDALLSGATIETTQTPEGEKLTISR